MDMKLILRLLFAAAVLGNHVPASALAKPNIVFILAADLGWNGLGCPGQRAAVGNGDCQNEGATGATSYR